MNQHTLTNHGSSNAAWVGFALVSALSFAGMAVGVRLASEHLPLSEVVFFRNFIALLVLMPLVMRNKTSLKTKHFPFHMLRAGAGIIATYFYFYALDNLHVADALLLNYTSPIFIALFAVVWLKEDWTLHRRIALGLSLLGLALLFRPSSDLFSAAGLSGLCSGALAGLALTTVKRLTNTDDPVSIVVWFALLSSLVTAVPMFWFFEWPTPMAWMWLILVGFCGSLGQLSLTWAYQRAPVTQVSPLGYSSLIFAGLFGYLLWDELTDLIGFIGIVCITIAGIVVARERSIPAPQPPSTVPIIDASLVEEDAENHDMKIL